MRKLTKKTRGLTLTELLVVMLIMSLLATMAVPVYINRMEEARVRLALAEAREIAQAEEQVAIIHGFYVPFQVLDDAPESLNVPINADTIRDEFQDIALINPLVPAYVQSQPSYLQPRLADYFTNGNPRVRSLVDNWAGPFLNPQRIYLDEANEGRPGDIEYVNASYFRYDFPLDPWGTPYRFYSSEGIIGSNAFTQNYTNLNENFSDGVITTQDDRNLDRYAVISWGRDGLPNDFNGSVYDDDIVYLFGSNGVESTFGMFY